VNTWANQFFIQWVAFLALIVLFSDSRTEKYRVRNLILAAAERLGSIFQVTQRTCRNRSNAGAGQDDVIDGFAGHSIEQHAFDVAPSGRAPTGLPQESNTSKGAANRFIITPGCFVCFEESYRDAGSR
jgi:hypothetical protein